MADKARPLFLERRSYRRRRFMDALKLLVFLGLILWMIPTLWPDGTQGDVKAMPTSRALFYVFGVWVLLIGLAAVFERFQRAPEPGVDRADPPT